MSEPLSPDRWRRVNDVFHVALNVDPPLRAAWLDAQCAGDAALRREVESLLHADADPGGDGVFAMAVRDAVNEATAARAPVGPAQRMGPYRILHEIGRGGMATVFLAVRDDDQFEQRVAIKVVRGVLGSESLRRFRSERQILASLGHDCIARLLDGGTTDDGVPYLVMEYVEGQAIDEYCNIRRLTLAERLALFCRVCDAVNHAHHSLVVHRDIKPSNILVTAEGTPKLLDFGIAKLIDDGLNDEAPVTQTGFRALTPEYASPEQVRGEPITTASDVYSLGVLLYELLTGQRPLTFRTRQAAEIVLVVCTAEPRKPSTVVERGRPSRQLVGDLDTIVLTALAKEPSRRYATAEALADDVRRHLTGLPVQARPATWRYRSTRFVGRHRGGVVMAAAFVAVVIVLGVALVQQIRDVARERDTATQVTNLLLEMYASFDQAGAGGSRLTAQEVLERGASRIETDLGVEPELQARMLDAIGSLYGTMGQPARATGLLQKSLAVRQAIGPDTLATAVTLTHLANAMRADGRAAMAETPAREALAISRRLAGPRAPVTADALNALGLILALQGRPVEGASLIGEAVSIWHDTEGADSEQFANGLRNLLRTWRERGDYPRAEQFDRAELLRVERVERERLAARRRASGDGHALTADTLLSLGRLLDAMGRDGEAEPFLREALAARQAMSADGPEGVGEAQQALAHVLQDHGKLDEAERLYRASLAAANAVAPDAGIATGTLGDLASVLEASGRLDEAEGLYRRVLEQRKRLVGPERLALARSQRAIARLLIKRNRAAEARPLVDEAVTICRDTLGADAAETRLTTQLQREIGPATGR